MTARLSRFLGGRKIFETLFLSFADALEPGEQAGFFAVFHKMQHTSSPILPYPKRKRMRMP